MTRLIALLGSLLLAACAAPETRKAQEGPAYHGQRDLEALVSFFTGNWDARAGEPPVRLRVAEFWRGSQVRWLYLEWVDLPIESRPRRQMVLRLAEGGEDHLMSSTAYRLPGDPARFAGAWRNPDSLAALKPRDLDEIAGCRLRTMRAMAAHFTIVTEGNKCPSGRPEFPFIRYEFSITSSELELLEQPRDAAGNVPPSRLEPYRFGRMSREPK